MSVPCVRERVNARGQSMYAYACVAGWLSSYTCKRIMSAWVRL